MKAADPQSLRIEIRPGETVSALLIRPQHARACYVFAHGAGAGMAHSSMEATAAGLAERGIATLRYQFPYMEKGGKRPDPPAVAHAAVRAAVAEAGAMLSRAAADCGRKIIRRADDVAGAGDPPLPGVRGLAFLGFPLHPAGKPSSERAKHLADVEIPMLFLQGTRDALAELNLLEPVVKRPGLIGNAASAEGADHSFHVLKSSGRNDREVLDEALDAFAAWVDGVVGS